MSDCGACLYFDDFDAASFYCRETRKARKAHTCFECHRTIQPGEHYEVVSGKWDGSISTYHTCAECVDIGTAMSCDGSRLHGGLWEMMADIRHEVGWGCLQKLTLTSAKVKLQDWINEGRDCE